MSTHFLELKNRKNSDQISLGFLLSFWGSSMVINFTIDIGILYLFALAGAFLVSWIIFRGNRVDSFRALKFNARYSILTPNFEDLHHESNLKKMKSLQGIIRSENNHDSQKE